MSLLIDAGNSRVKWAVRRGGRLGRMYALEWRRGAEASVARQVLERAGTVEGILVVSVGGAALERALRAAAARRALPPPRFVASAPARAGVRNGYREAWRLGADRWVALVGARALALRLAARAAGGPRGVCVVDAGTALTIDLLDAGGRHGGGAIVPGPRLMVDVLLERTSGIRERAAGTRRPPRQPPLFARDTLGGIRAGALHACAALVERAVARAAVQLGRRPLLLLTGGAAASLAPLLRGRTRVEHDLVLQGLAVLDEEGTRWPARAKRG